MPFKLHNAEDHKNYKQTDKARAANLLFQLAIYLFALTQTSNSKWKGCLKIYY